MESEDAPTSDSGEKRNSVMVIRTDDLMGVIKRAKANEFLVGQSTETFYEAVGATVRETAITGPAGNAVVIYQIGN